MEFPFNTQGLALVIEVRGSIALRVSEHNPEINQFEDWDKTYGRGDSPDSREPTPDTTAKETVAYLQIGCAKYPENGYSFGRSSSCFVVLPKVGKSGISGTHFRIYVSEYRTWMLRNESKNGTIVGEECEWGSVALQPGLRNCIRVQDITLIIHILTGWVSPFKGRTPAFPTSSCGTSSSVFELEPIPKYEAGSNSSYHVLEQQRITPEGSQYRAIHTITGRPVVAIRCIGDTKKSQQRYNLISTLSPQTDSIVPYLDFIAHGANDTIITKYVDGTTLKECCLERQLTDLELLGLYRQMIDCLCFLREKGIQHGDIRQGTIIATRRPFKVYLAGFSESIEIFSSSGVDVADLCRTYRSVALDTPDDSGDPERGSMREDPETGSMRGDPEIATLVRQVLSSAPENCMSASKINLHIHSLVGDTQGGPFAMVTVVRSWQLKIRRKGRMLFVEVAALLDRLLAQRRNISLVTRSRPERYAYNYLCGRELFDGIEFCTSGRALKFCSAFNLTQFSRIIQIEVSKNRALQNSPVLILEGEKELFQIGYHVPAMMFNLTHIAEVLGWRHAFLKDPSIPQTFQEVDDEIWGGTYVDRSFCISFLRGKHDGIKQPIHEVEAIPNPVLSAQFTSNSPEYILLFTGRLRPSMIAVRRTDCFVNWTPSSENDPIFLSPEESYVKCDTEGLPHLKERILTLKEKPRMLDWSSWGPCLETVHHDGSDTSVNTDESDDEGHFKFKLK